MGFSSWAATHDETTDHITISQVNLAPGGNEGYFVVSLSGSQKYTALGLDIIIPDGYCFSIKTNGEAKVTFSNEKKQGMYPVTNQDEVDEEDADPEYNSHNLDYNMVSSNLLRATVWSTKSLEFAKNSGKLFRVYIKATPYAKPGPANIEIKDCFFTSSEGIQFDTKDLTISDMVSASETSSVPVSVSSSLHWSTLVLPFACAIPDGVKAYTAGDTKDEEEVNYLVMNEVESFEAYTPYVLYSETGFSGTVEGTVNPSEYPASGVAASGYLRGAIVPQTITDGYVMQNLNGTVKFYNCGGDEFSIPAGKCWVEVPSTVKSFGFIIDDGTTGIKSLNIDARKSADMYFNTAGQRVTSSYKGITINNGKKTIRK